MKAAEKLGVVEDAPSAGNPHAGCDVAGAGNGFTVWLLRHSQRKRGATARPDLRNTAPVLDPTGMATGIRKVLASLKISIAIGVFGDRSGHLAASLCVFQEQAVGQGLSA
jgi:hypothetical protein